MSISQKEIMCEFLNFFLFELKLKNKIIIMYKDLIQIHKNEAIYILKKAMKA